MVGKNYPANWDELRRSVLEQHLHRCVNCRLKKSGLEIHHIVPVGYGGSHRRSNLVPLCRVCHAAAHERQMAPRIRWYTNGQLSSHEFGEHLSLWKRMREKLGVPRYDPDEEVVYIPLADADKIVEQMET